MRDRNRVSVGVAAWVTPESGKSLAAPVKCHALTAWVAIGIQELEEYLAKHARFAEYLEQQHEGEGEGGNL